jgi:hypothetical protein
MEVFMYHINNFPNSKHTFSIALNDTGKFWQLTDNQGGVIAESNSWRELKKYAEYKKLSVTFYKNK